MNLARCFPFRSRSSSFLGVLIAGCPTFAACAPPGEQALAEAVVEGTLSSQESRSMSREMLELRDGDPARPSGAPPAPDEAPAPPRCIDDPAVAAARAAQRPSVALVPSSCVTKTAEENRVHIELDHCSGRFGRATLDGGLDAVVTRNEECSLHVEVDGNDDLRANGRPLDYAASADVSLASGGERIAWHASWSGTTPRGRSIHHETSLDVLADPSSGCVDAVGTASGDVDGHAYEIEVESLAVCPDLCPTSGIVHGTLEGRRRDYSLTVRFDGSRFARVTGWSGRDFDVEMICDEVAE